MQLLYCITYVGLISTRGNVKSPWLDKMLAALKSFSGYLFAIYCKTMNVKYFIIILNFSTFIKYLIIILMYSKSTERDKLQNFT